MKRKLEVHLLGQDENGWKQEKKIPNIFLFKKKEIEK